MGLEYRFNIPQTYCEKWPVGCQFCDLLLCDGKKETAIAKISERDYKTVEAKPTNADRIRAMSDEELALYFAATFEVDAFDGTGNSYKKWLDWLRQEGENGKTD